MTQHERFPEQYDRPTVDQLLGYRDLMVDILHQQGRGIRRARIGEVAKTQPDTEYLLPGSHTEWSALDKKLQTHIERDRTYSASYRAMGEGAARLCILETDSVLINPATYATNRNMYRFSWDDTVGVYESEVLPIETISSSYVDAEVVESGPVGVREILVMDHEETVENAPDGLLEYTQFINPLRESVNAWSAVDATQFDLLTMRTDDYGHDMLEALQREREQ